MDRDKILEFTKFALVGASGVVVNMGLLYLLTDMANLKVEFASPIAIEVSILTNFTLNNAWTFRKRRSPVPFFSRLLRYHLVTGVAGIVNYLTLILLVKLIGMNELLANLIGIALGTVINFFLNSLWTWRKRSAGPASR
jgi:dolichol-phosphate mannosyltransferase